MTSVERLNRLDTCAVADALDKLGERGTVNGIRPLTGPAKIAGRVVTVKLVAAQGATKRTVSILAEFLRRRSRRG